MDPASDPPPAAAVASSPSAAATVTGAAANASPIQSAGHNHPPYAEMISAAIAALNEREGSSKRAIAKYIETQYSDLPSTHSALLTHHLKRLKTNGQILMVKHSYKLPGARSASAPAAVNGAVTVESADPASSVPKRRPGRPPKPKPDAVQAAVPVFPPPINMNDVPVVPPAAQPIVAAPPEDAYIAAAPVNGVSAAPVRGRGRPPKHSGVKRGRGRPPKSGGGGEVSRGRGRPKKNATLIAAPPAVAAAPVKGAGRPRGRPPKPVSVVEGFAPGGGIAAAPVDVAPPSVTPLAGKRRRGRPAKAGNLVKKARHINAAVLKSPRKLSGKPLGRPRKNFEAPANRNADSSQLLVAYLDLKAKLENLQSKVKQTVTLARPSLSSDADAAINALQELELLAVNATGAPPNVDQIQQQQQPLPEQVQPQS